MAQRSSRFVVSQANKKRWEMRNRLFDVIAWLNTEHWTYCRIVDASTICYYVSLQIYLCNVMLLSLECPLSLVWCFGSSIVQANVSWPEYIHKIYGFIPARSINPQLSIAICMHNAHASPEWNCWRIARFVEVWQTHKEESATRSRSHTPRELVNEWHILMVGASELFRIILASNFVRVVLHTHTQFPYMLIDNIGYFEWAEMKPYRIIIEVGIAWKWKQHFFLKFRFRNLLEFGLLLIVNRTHYIYIMILQFSQCTLKTELKGLELFSILIGYLSSISPVLPSLHHDRNTILEIESSVH